MALGPPVRRATSAIAIDLMQETGGDSLKGNGMFMQKEGGRVMRIVRSRAEGCCGTMALRAGAQCTSCMRLPWEFLCRAPWKLLGRFAWGGCLHIAQCAGGTGGGVAGRGRPLAERGVLVQQRPGDVVDDRRHLVTQV
jgi:hypothetical protein